MHYTTIHTISTSESDFVNPFSVAPNTLRALQNTLPKPLVFRPKGNGEYGQNVHLLNTEDVVPFNLLENKLFQKGNP